MNIEFMERKEGKKTYWVGVGEHACYKAVEGWELIMTDWEYSEVK